MKEKQNPLWVILCVMICLMVTVAILACLPAWESVGAMSALEAIIYTVKQWISGGQG